MAIVVLAVLAGALRLANYTLYMTAVAAAVLIALDFAHPTDLATEGRRILFTFIGVAIAIAVMALAGLLTRLSASRRTHPSTG